MVVAVGYIAYELCFTVTALGGYAPFGILVIPAIMAGVANHHALSREV